MKIFAQYSEVLIRSQVHVFYSKLVRSEYYKHSKDIRQIILINQSLSQISCSNARDRILDRADKNIYTIFLSIYASLEY